MRGVDGADSWATDLHKMLNVPYESALVAVRDGRALHGSMASAAPYLPAAGSDAALLPELQNSRRARGVAAWAARYVARREQSLRVTKYFVSLVQPGCGQSCAREVLSDGTGLTSACVLRFGYSNDAMCEDAVFCVL